MSSYDIGFDDGLEKGRLEVLGRVRETLQKLREQSAIDPTSFFEFKVISLEEVEREFGWVLE